MFGLKINLLFQFFPECRYRADFITTISIPISIYNIFTLHNKLY